MVEAAQGLAEPAALALGSVFGAGLLLALLRRWWSQQDNAFEADKSARHEERESCEEQIARIRIEHQAEVARVEARFIRRYEASSDAVRKLVDLMPEELRPEAAAIVLDMTIAEGADE